MSAKKSVLIFDLDDTLWPGRPTLVHANRLLWNQLVQACPAIADTFTPTGLSALKDALLTQQPELETQITRLRQRCLEMALRQAGYPTKQAGPQARLLMAEFRQARQQVQPFPGVANMLWRCRQAGHRLGALTNGNAFVNSTPLGQYFDFAWRAEQLDARKPDPFFFLRGLAREGIAPPAAIYIGDHPELDVLGARAAGLLAYWYNPGQKKWTDTSEAPVQIHDWRRFDPNQIGRLP
jgi:putative hydrolase of the HAD superfamily